MKKIVILILAVGASFWISGVSAGKYPGKHSPESILTCAADETYRVAKKSISETIDVGKCRTIGTVQPSDPCAPCITSLESQGCEIIDVSVDILESANVITYLLSCVKP